MRQWAILIGLNNYQMFQPLNCAQQDVQALQQVLIHEVGLPAEQCIVLTDSSPPISGRATYPTQANLQSWIELLAQQCFKPGDTLWFFFSGYGVCSQGRDYIVPIDGDPFAVETTCILMSDIFSRLQAAISPGLPLLLFDMNRSQGNFSNENVGLQTARLAKQLAVPMISSCQPGQYSRDISGLGHGLFTIALLEALRYHQAATPATLMRFLGDRLPELGAYYYLPNQQPLAFCPPDKFHQPLLHAHFTHEDNVAETPAADSHSSVLSQEEYGLNGTNLVMTPVSTTVNGSPFSSSPNAIASQATATLPAMGSPAIKLDAVTPTRHPADPFAQPTPSQFAGTPHNADPAIAPTQTLLNRNGQPLSIPPEPPTAGISTGENSIAALTTSTESSPSLIPAAPGPTGSNSPPSNPPQTPPMPESTPDETEETTAPRLWLPILLWGGLLSLGLITSVLWRNWSEIQAPPPVPSSSPTPTTSPSIAPVGTPTQPTPEVPAAVASPTTVPVPSPTPSTLTFEPGTAPAVMSGTAILQNARQRVLSDQATPYRDAIDAARQIPSTDPSYVDAQQEIAAWSQRIFEIAQERAARKEWDTAIMAAAMVPPDDRKLFPQAQALIAQWCPLIQPRTDVTFTLQKAKGICSQPPAP